MGAVKAFYMDCAENGIFPLESSKPRPSGVRLQSRWMRTGLGDCFCVTGISVADAIKWWNAKPDREVPAPTGLREFLTDFAGCEHCDDCGCVGNPHCFVVSGHGERFCDDCA